VRVLCTRLILCEDLLTAIQFNSVQYNTRRNQGEFGWDMGHTFLVDSLLVSLLDHRHVGYYTYTP
jgi:hypothetical protein